MRYLLYDFVSIIFYTFLTFACVVISLALGYWPYFATSSILLILWLIIARRQYKKLTSQIDITHKAIDDAFEQIELVKSREKKIVVIDARDSEIILCMN